MLVEQLGSGMRKILEKYDKIIFSFSPNYLRVTFLYDEPLSATIHEPINGSLSDTRKLVLAVLIENPEGMYQDIARKTGLSRSTVSRARTKLRDEKRIIRIGAKKSGYGKVIRE